MKYEQWLIIEEGREKDFVILNLFLLVFRFIKCPWMRYNTEWPQADILHSEEHLFTHSYLAAIFFLFVFCHQTSDRSEVNEPKNVVDFTMNEYDFMVIILEFDDNIDWLFIRIFYRFNVDHYGGQFSVAIFILRWLI